MSFFNDSVCPIGLDISDLSIKLIQLKKKGANIRIQALGKTDLPEGLLENGEIKNKKELVKAIKKLVGRPDFGKVSTSEAIICLPEGKTFLKIVEVEKETLDLKKAVENELQKHVPMPLENLYYDWQLIGNSSRSNLILAGAAPKNIVDGLLELLAEARLSTVAIETEPISICRCLMEEENPKYKGATRKNYAIIDVGATDASLTVYAKGTIIFSVSLPVSGEAMTAKIATALSLNHEEAEKIKILYGLSEQSDQPEVKNIFAETIGDLTDRLKGSINFFNNHFSSWGPIEKMLVCGGGANIKNLAETIGKKTGIETANGDVFVNFQASKKNFFSKFEKTFGLNADLLTEEKNKKLKTKQSKTIKVSHDTSLSYATAIGLALRGLFIDE